MSDRASEALAEGFLPGEPRKYDAISKRSNVPLSSSRSTELDMLQSLRTTDPRDDKARIQQTQSGLLQDSYHWVLENAELQRWRDDEHSRFLWVTGDRGKGKTMLLCRIIDEVKTSLGNTGLLSFFFCQATDTRINTSTAVLRGPIYLLAEYQPSLISYIRKRYDHAGSELFKDANSWVVLFEILTSMLENLETQKLQFAFHSCEIHSSASNIR